MNNIDLCRPDGGKMAPGGFYIYLAKTAGLLSPSKRLILDRPYDMLDLVAPTAGNRPGWKVGF